MQAANQSVDRLMEILGIPGVSTEEDQIAAHIEKYFRELGVPAASIKYDRAQDQSEYGGGTGNLIIHLPRRGGHTGAARLFMAHMDVVSLCRGAKPRLVPAGQGQPARIVNDNPASALGSDNRTGVAVLLHTARFLLSGSMPHPPVWFVFSVQEELGLIGARGFDVDCLKPDRPAMGFNCDHEGISTIVTGVIGTTRFFMDLYGKAAHTGLYPEDGVSTAVAASIAVADLARDGWHGLVKKDGSWGTANIGVMQGGEMTNTCMPKMIIRGEARSHDPVFRQKIVDKYRETFQRACAETRNKAGECVRMEWKLGPCYDSYALPPDAPVAKLAFAASATAGVKAEPELNNGGMDSNWMNSKGIPMVTIGTGQHGAHTIAEWINVDEFLTSCRMAEELALG